MGLCGITTRVSWSGFERLFSGFLVLAGSTAAVALTILFGNWGLLSLGLCYWVAFFLLLTGLTKWRPLKYCCYRSAGTDRSHNTGDEEDTAKQQRHRSHPQMSSSAGAAASIKSSHHLQRMAEYRDEVL